MSEYTKVKKPSLERNGLNSLRDFFLDHWAGLNLENDEDAEKHLQTFIDGNDEEKIINRLSKGKVFLFFIMNSQHRYRLKTQPPKEAGYEFKITAVDQNISLVYLRAKRNDEQCFKHISAELTGHYRLLKKMDFDKVYTKSWMGCRIADKVICINELKMILSNEAWTEAFLNYNPFFTAKEYYHWSRKYGIDFPIRKGFRRLLSDIVKHIKK